MVERELDSQEPLTSWKVGREVAYSGTGWLINPSAFVVDYESKPLERWVVEEVNVVPRAQEQWAWQTEDVVSRIQKLALSEPERAQLVEADELEMLTGHLAETAHLLRFPYELVFYQGKMGSVKTIQGDNGRPVHIFRGVVDMLRARTIKFPDDARSMITLEVFEAVIEPQARKMEQGERLVFFSPPAHGGVENRYGFMYVYEKKKNLETGDEILDCQSMMLDLTGAEYRKVIDGWNEYRVDETSMPELVQTMVLRLPKKLFVTEGEMMEEILGKVWQSRGGAELFGKQINNLTDWVQTQKNLYANIKSIITANSLSKEYVSAILGGKVELANKILEWFRKRILQQFLPKVWNWVQDQIKRFGYAMINLGCGPMRFGGMALDGLSRAMMGILDPDLYEYVCDICGYVNPIDVPNHKYCEYCAGCGSKVEKCG